MAFIIQLTTKISRSCKRSAGLFCWAIISPLSHVPCQGLTPLFPAPKSISAPDKRMNNVRACFLRGTGMFALEKKRQNIIPYSNRLEKNPIHRSPLGVMESGFALTHFK